MSEKTNWLVVLVAGWLAALAIAITLAYFMFSGVSSVVERSTRSPATADQSSPGH
jgi:hypothetical protein